MRSLKTAALIAFAFLATSSHLSIYAEENGLDPPKTAENARSIAEYYRYSKVRVVTIAKVGTKLLRFSGSGFFIDDIGHVLTASHVVIGIDNEFLTHKGTVRPDLLTYYVQFAPKNPTDGKIYERRYFAFVTGTDPYRDLAILKVLGVDPKDYNVAKIGDSDTLQLNDTVYT